MKPYVNNILFFLVSFSFLNASGIFVNQSGYLPGSPKLVYTDDGSQGFVIKDAQSDETLYTGTFPPVSGADPFTSMFISKSDFSNFTSEGEYYAVTDNGAVSEKFSISEDVFSEVFNKSLKGFYYQRCGYQLLIQHAGSYHHLRCHKLDGSYHPTTGESGFRLSTGGWHDAGDYGKYVVNAGVTVGTMLLAYELFPEKFSGDNLEIPESGNGIPDLLDEIRYELKWLLTMQHNDGGVYTKLTPEQFSGMIMPHADNSGRLIYRISSTATGDYAAMMAMASRIYKNFDADFAGTCLEAAELAWAYLESHPDIVPTGGFRNPAGTVTGEYGDGNDRDERFWASVELFKSTNKEEYKNYISANISQFLQFSGSLSWPNLRELALISYLYSGNAGNPDIITNIKTALAAYCNQQLNITEQNVFGLAMKNGDFNWGSNSHVLNQAIMFIVNYEQTGDENYFNAALNQLNYIIGTNGHGLSFVTSVGGNHVMNPHHRQSVADGIDEPVPGLLSGGPNQYLNDPVLQSHFNSSTPPALCFIDDEGSYASNEIAINWNAPLVFVAGYFSTPVVSTLNESRGNNTPEELKSFPNYPNPFNGGTVMRFVSERSGDALLKVYDILGNLISKESVEIAVGENSYSWSPYNISGKQVNSGVYFYRLEGEFTSNYEKMIFLK